jgi:ParB family chromosome partitioning protein
MQPILVRPVSDAVSGPRYEIIAGERRWRAARLAGLAEVPALVREVPDSAALAMALIENIQREDLNPIEEATGVQRLIREFSMTHEQAAAAIGRSRSATTNLLRLLSLAGPVQQMLMRGQIDMGHARALLTLDTARQTEAAARIAARGLSAREAEALAATLARVPRSRAAPRADRDLKRLEEDVSDRLGTTVRIRPGRKGSGRVVVHYSSLEHLEQLLRKLR